MKQIEVTAEELNMIQAYRTVAQQKGAAKASGNNGSDQDESKLKRTYHLQPVFKVLGKARSLNQRQVSQAAENRAKCIDIVLASLETLYPDPSQFRLDFRAESERLTDSKRFCRDCEDLGLASETVADNIVFEGKMLLEKVLKDGIQVLGERISMFNTPLWGDHQEDLEDLPAEYVNEEGTNA